MIPKASKSMKRKNDMLVIGLTGGIGMGKSTATKALRGMGLPVYHADRAVHSLLRKGGGAREADRAAFSGTVRGGAVDRKKLGQIVFGKPQKLKQLEKILHPMVQGIEREFFHKARAAKAPAAILEIPLLFETGADKRCDVVLCVTSTPRRCRKSACSRAPA